MMDEQKVKEVLDSAFPGLSQEELDGVVRVVRIVTYKPDMVVCQEGAMETTLYVILDGWVEISKYLEGDTPRVLHHQGPGEFFGEMALIDGKPRSADARRTTLYGSPSSWSTFSASAVSVSRASRLSSGLS